MFNTDHPPTTATEHYARMLVVALELLRRHVYDSPSFQFANRDRGNEPAPTWAQEAFGKGDS